MKQIILFIAAMVLSLATYAQSYRTAAGLRFDSDKALGVSIQQKIYNNITLEGILLSHTNDNAISVALLVEQHNKLLFKNFNIYFGAGVHKTWKDTNQDTDLEEISKGGAGPAGVVGVEASLGRFNLAWDVQPKANLWGGNRFLNMSSGFTIRYIILKKKKKKFNWKFWKKK